MRKRSLENTYPEIAQSWCYEKNDELSPAQITPHSNKKVWWNCSRGHSFQMTVNNRVTGHGCGYCAGKKVLKGFNDFESKYPEASLEWDYEKNQVSPDEVLAHSHKKYYWICSKCGYKWLTSPDLRSIGHGCPKCAKNCVISGHNDLKTSFPEIALEWDYQKNGTLLPNKISGQSHKKVWWKCKRGHSWESTVQNRTAGNNGCPTCQGYLRTSFPEQAIFYYLNQVVKCENGKVISKKELDIYIPSKRVGIEYDGHVWHKEVDRDIEKDRIMHENNIKLLRIREIGCPKYNFPDSFWVSAGDMNNLALAINWVFKSLNLNSPEIDIDRDYDKIILQFVCNVGEKSLASTYPDLLKEWDYNRNGELKPEMFSYGSMQKVWWTCPKGHSYEAAINNKIRKTSCPYCSNRRILKGYNDFCTLYPRIAKEWDYEKNVDIDPGTMSHTSTKRVWWKCADGHSWQARIASRCNNNSDCRICASRKGRTHKGINTIDVIRPDLLMEWDYNKNANIKPEEIAAHSNKKVWWTCPKGHSYQMNVNNRINNHNCPKCKMKSIINNETEEVFDSITSAAIKYNCSISAISRCLKGLNKTAKGYHWSYYDK